MSEELIVKTKVPSPKVCGNMSVEEALANRQSQRDFQDIAISADQLLQILWATYGVTPPDGLRTTPSAGAIYPLEVYAVIGNVEGIESGVYRYIPDKHEVVKTVGGDVRRKLCEAALNQKMVAKAPASVVFSTVLSRMTKKYGDRGVPYVYVEVGHAAQNVYLQAEALGLGTCAVGAFTDKSVKQILHLPAKEEPLYLMPIGYCR